MFLIKTSRRWGNLDKEEEAEGISSEAFQLSSTRAGGVFDPLDQWIEEWDNGQT